MLVFLHGTCERRPCNFSHPRINAKQKKDMLDAIVKAKGKGKSSKKDAAPGARQRSSSQNSQGSNRSNKSQNSQHSQGSGGSKQPRSRSRGGRKGAKALASVPPPPKPTQERERKPRIKAKAAPASHLRHCDAYLTQAGCHRQATGECTLWHVPEEVKNEMIAKEKLAKKAYNAQK